MLEISVLEDANMKSLFRLGMDSKLKLAITELLTKPNRV